MAGTAAGAADYLAGTWPCRNVRCLRLALAVRGYSGKQRAAFFRRHRWSMLAGGGCCGIVGSGLSLTVIGLLLLTPMAFIGIAARFQNAATGLPEDKEASE